jgi:hypothetical protein
MIRRLAIWVLTLYCADCNGLIWTWQPRCGPRHTDCKHAGDARIAATNGIVRWKCDWCGA